MLWQAGSSDRGRDFAAKHAEAIFAVHPNVARMREYTDDLDQRLETKFRRAPGSVKRIYGVQTVVGLTRSEADEKYQRIRECIPLEGAVAWISGHFGPDFSKYDPNEIVQNIEIPGIQGLFDSIIYAKGGAPVTVREAALIYPKEWGCRGSLALRPTLPTNLSISSTRARRRLHAGGDLYARLLRGIRRSRCSGAAEARPVSKALYRLDLAGEPPTILSAASKNHQPRLCLSCNQ